MAAYRLASYLHKNEQICLELPLQLAIKKKNTIAKTTKLLTAILSKFILRYDMYLFLELDATNCIIENFGKKSKEFVYIYRLIKIAVKLKTKV